jgi:site-specific recombinase XerC
LKDKSYRATPLGLEVARYHRWKKTEWGASSETLRGYESVLARTSLYFADLELLEFNPPIGTERLRECWDHWWGDLSPKTRAWVRSIWVDFFDWCVRERGLYGNPARALAAPKRRKPPKRLFDPSFEARVLAAQDYLADKLACDLILRRALRKMECAGVRFGDFDRHNRELTVLGKGLKTRVVPIVSEGFWRDLAQVRRELQPDPEWFLVAYRRKVGMKTYYNHHRGMKQRSMHNWWYDRLQAAGFVGERGSSSRAGLNMHRGRHTVATNILRKTGNIVAASELLGHESIETTRDAYAEFDTNDLRAVLLSLEEDAE